MTHDRDRCPECVSGRARRLMHRGLNRRTARELRDGMPLVAAQFAALESATDAQIAQINEAAQATWAAAGTETTR